MGVDSLSLPDRTTEIEVFVLKGRVLPRQKAIDQLNVTDFVIHNIAPRPHLCGPSHRRSTYSLILYFVAVNAAALAG